MKTFRDNRVFVLSPIPKNDSMEIMEILQKRRNTEIMIVWKSRKFYKNAVMLKYENIALETVEMPFKSHQSQNN